jgi:Ca-activated chloride channel family protein
MFMAYDEEALKAIAETTRGEYFHAASAAELQKIYQGLNAQLVLEKKETEVSALVIAAATILLLGSALLSLLWFNRMV